jgi:DNA repair exonuclease SbcCD nuclease subunit
MQSTRNFIHFGCWNKGGCPQDNDLTRVLQKIRLLVDKPQFLSICGDNYYPTVEKIKQEGKKDVKKKYFMFEHLLSGFRCLPSDIPIYMTYGNHDFETNLYINQSEQEQICTLTKNEIDIVKNQFSNIHLHLFQSTPFGTNTQLLFLDTTVYDEDDIEEYEQCYKEVDEKYTSSEKVKEAQINFIRSFLSSMPTSTTHLIIVGHHPIAQYKYKKEKMQMFAFHLFARLLFDEIHIPLKEKNIQYFYLCADLHHYQRGHVTINNEMHVQQFIVGTGGAEKDELVKEKIPREPIMDNDVQYVMNDEDIELSQMKNGFLKCTLKDSGGLDFEFIEVDLVGGVKRKCRKSKKLNAKCRKKRKTQRKKILNKIKRP